MPDFVSIGMLSLVGWLAVGRRDYIGVGLVIALAFAMGADHV